MPIDPAGQHLYFDPDTGVLRNHFGVTDPTELQILAGLVAATAAAELLYAAPPQRFDLEQLREDHQHLFEGVYPWAGQLRAVDIINQHDPTTAAPTPIDLIATRAQVTFEQLAREYDLLRTIPDPTAWADRAAYFYGELMRTRPFLDGNARAAGTLLTQMATDAGHDLDWTRVTTDQLAHAYRTLNADPETPNREPLRRTLHAALGAPSQQRTVERLDLLDQLDAHLDMEAAAAELLHDPTIDPALAAGIREDWPNITAAVTSLIVDERQNRDPYWPDLVAAQVGSLEVSRSPDPDAAPLEVAGPRWSDPNAAANLAERAANLKQRRDTQRRPGPGHPPPPTSPTPPRPGPRR